MSYRLLAIAAMGFALGCGGSTGASAGDAGSGGDAHAAGDATGDGGATGDAGPSPDAPADSPIDSPADSPTGLPEGSAGGDGAVGNPCSADPQCAGATCLGGAFTGGYCASGTTECNPSNDPCPTGSSCIKFQATDIDGGPASSPGGVDFCVQTCTGASDCTRAGYTCCTSKYAEPSAMVCVPPSMC
jgi:hypothetical protein